jgi:hypothetical protein
VNPLRRRFLCAAGALSLPACAYEFPPALRQDMALNDSGVMGLSLNGKSFPADKPGAWVWHCRILSHAEAVDAMFGMVTALSVS